MMTEELGTRAFSMPGWTGAKRDAYAITHRCVFVDGRHYWRVTPDPHGEAYRENHVAGQVPLLLVRIEETRDLNDRVLASARLATEAMADSSDAREVIDSFAHLHAVVRILTSYQEALLLWHYKDEPRLGPVAAAAVRVRCARNARAALDGFVAYRATYDLYRDGGMVPLLRSYLAELRADVPAEIEPSPTFALSSVAALPIDGSLGGGWPEPCVTLGPGNDPDDAQRGDYDAWGGSADERYACAFRMAAGPDALYVSVDVRDDGPPVPPRAGRVYHSDSIGLAFDTDDDGIDDALYYLVADANGRARLLQVMRDKVQRSLNYEDYLDLGSDRAEAALVPTDDGYRWQASISWDMLRPFRPESGSRLGVEFLANNADAASGRARLRLKYPKTPVWRDPPPATFSYGVVGSEALDLPGARGPASSP